MMNIVVEKPQQTKLTITDIPIGSIGEVQVAGVIYYVYRINGDHWCWFSSAGNLTICDTKDFREDKYVILRVFKTITLS